MLDKCFYMPLCAPKSVVYSMRINRSALLRRSQHDVVYEWGHLRKQSREGSEHSNQEIFYISNAIRINGKRFVMRIAI